MLTVMRSWRHCWLEPVGVGRCSQQQSRQRHLRYVEVQVAGVESRSMFSQACSTANFRLVLLIGAASMRCE